LVSVIVNSIDIFIALWAFILACKLQVNEQQPFLITLFYFRVLLSTIEIFSFAWVIVILSVHPSECWTSERTDQEDLIFAASFGVLMQIMIGWCGLYCLTINEDDDPDDRCLSRLRVIFCVPQWQSSEFNQGNVETTLIKLTRLFDIVFLDEEEHTFTDNLVGLAILRLLHKHFRANGESLQPLLHESVCDMDWRPVEIETGTSWERRRTHLLPFIRSQNFIHARDSVRLKDLRYYSKYAIGAYGVLLEQLNNCCACCANPVCCRPKGVDRDEITGKSLLTNADLKVFLRVSDTSGDDLLFSCQSSALFGVKFYVVADHERKAVIFAIRGTLSLSDAVTDMAGCTISLDEIDESCLGHEGIIKAGRGVLKQIQNNGKVQDFLKTHPKYDTIITGHSLGAGTAVVLHVLMMQYPDKYRNLHSYPLAPPMVFVKSFIEKRPELFTNITCISNEKDIIPRLSVQGLLRLRIQMKLLFEHLDASNLYLFRKLCCADSNDLLKAMKEDCPFTIENIDRPWEEFRVMVKSQFDELLQTVSELPAMEGVEHTYGHTPFIYNCIYQPPSKRGWCCNSNDDGYTIYRADPNGFQEMIVSSRMMLDHMPDLYGNILAKLELR